MFEGLKQSLRDALNRASSPSERRAALAGMREALVEAKAGIAGLRAATEETRAQLAAERAELETVRRRGRLASGVGDAETVAVAARFERRHAQRVAVLEQKLTAREAELALGEREAEEMAAEFRAAAARVEIDPGGSYEPTAGRDDAELRRATDRMAREAEAERRLAELKRRMGR